MKAKRGQAVVESSLFLLVFVTVLIFAIHFAEIGYLTTKVQEAANAALWDSTSQKMHDTFANKWDLYKQAIPFAQGQSNKRYQDFNGLTSVDRQNALKVDGEGRQLQMVQVFTDAEKIDTRCENLQNISLYPVDPVRDTGIPTQETGMGCTSKAVLKGYGFPQWFLQKDTGGFFKEQHKQIKYNVCAAGRNDRAGKCAGRYVIELDDWGFSGPKERQECRLPRNGNTTCANQGYYDEVKRTYDAQVTKNGDQNSTAANDLAQAIVGADPLFGGNKENSFYMSFRGAESSYQENIGPAHGDSTWETTPFSARQEYNPYSLPRSGCWLGLDCKSN
jgi:hypothetical protein